MQFSDRLRKLRVEKGYDLQQMADLLGVSKGAISYYENDRRLPTVLKLKDISDILGVSTDYLLGNDVYEVADENVEYGTHLSNEEVTFIRELRKDPEVHKMIVKEPERIAKFVVKKLK